MSQTPDPEFDLESLFLPTWAKQPAANKYANFAGGEDRPRRGGHEDRGRRGFGGGGDRGPRGPRRDGPRREGPGGPGRSGDRGRGPRQDFEGRREERRETGPPPPELNVTFIPEEKGVEGLARQVRLTGRAYPLFEIAQLILRKPERFNVQLGIVKKPDGSPAQPLFLCSLDDTLWLSEAEVAGHLLHRHFDTFYASERIAGDSPKGTYTFVAQCGMSGVVLGPPNYHGYQEKLRQLHTERFSRMPFDVFKSRVKIVKDEAVVKQWLEEQSYKTSFTALNVPEPLKFDTRDQVEQHFRVTHLPNLVKPAELHTVAGVAARALPCMPLRNLVRVAWEDQSKFPIRLATTLSQQFGGHGLQFFKVNKTVTHVCVARPHFLDLDSTPVSGNVRTLIEFINSHPKCTRRRLLDTLAPAPVPAAAPPEAAATPPAPAAPAAPPMSPEQEALNADLHWLIHEGHVIEFATNGILETAKRPLPRPERPAKKPAPDAKPAPAADAPSTEDGVVELSESPAPAPANAGPAPAPEVPTPAPEPAPAATA